MVGLAFSGLFLAVLLFIEIFNWQPWLWFGFS